jgi:hypothetical protein
MAKTNFAFSPVVHSFQTQLTLGSERVGFVEIERQPLKRVSRALAVVSQEVGNIESGRIEELESSLFERLKRQIEPEPRFLIEMVRIEACGYRDHCQK